RAAVKLWWSGEPLYGGGVRFHHSEKVKLLALGSSSVAGDCHSGSPLSSLSAAVVAGGRHHTSSTTTAAAAAALLAAATTYFHSYSFVPAGGAGAPVPPAAAFAHQHHHHQAHQQQQQHHHHHHQQQHPATAAHQHHQHHHQQHACTIACASCAVCNCNAAAAAAAAAAVNQQTHQIQQQLAYAAAAAAATGSTHHHQQQQHAHHHRPTAALAAASAATTATVLLQPLDRVKDTMRGSDELLSQSGAVSNGAAMSPQPHHAADNNNEAKKAKLDKSQNGKPSRVIHIRNIPNEVSEGEIIHLGMPFGRVTNVLVLKGKNQAFLEMADENAAATMVTYYASCPAQLRGRAVYVQFSNHRELKTDQAHNNAGGSPTNAIANTSNNTNVQTSGQGQVQGSDTQGGPNTVLRVIVEHMVYPISLDILYQIFTRYGKVLKIVTFTKN
ncbi:homeobox protein vnd-like, partial [Phymastichus coffea]|uniref:homeobox protein vnd-like n=1 Tax=Phymastichus coffea TaxID=108790 RepID=UPI00273BF872